MAGALPASVTRIGMLTPSSNTVIEPITAAMLAPLPDVTVHFARFTVMTIGLDGGALAQFDSAPMLAAARQLADARVHAIAWNGTSAGWLGVEADERLCEQITQATGIRAVTSVLSLNALLEQGGHTRIALVTPYTSAVQRRIIATYHSAGFEVVAERHLSLSDNFSFCEVDARQIEQMVRTVAAAQPDVIIPFCTNLAAAPLAAAMEDELGIPIFDTVAVAVRGALDAAGYARPPLRGWGSLFAEPSKAFS